MSITTSKESLKQLEALMDGRFQGASMMKGSAWQVLVCLERALTVLESNSPDAYLRLEGFEDVDVFDGVKFECVQAKARTRFGWKQFKEVLTSFAQVAEHDPGAQFELRVPEDTFTKDVEVVAKFHQGLNPRQDEIDRVVERAREVCESFGLDPRVFLTTRMTIVCCSREKTWEAVAKRFMCLSGCTPESTAMHMHHIAHCLLEGAGKRQQLTIADLGALLDASMSAASMERSGYEARSRNLLTPIDWRHVDASHHDFFEGKSVRPGHIVSNLDVPRTIWMDEIENALAGQAHVCLIKSSSGQGKSTLMYRYAHDHFKEDEVYRLEHCETLEHVGLVVEMLKTKVRLGRRVRLLIDGADWRTAFWTDVARTCSEFGIPTLVAVRHEDFHRYGSHIGFVTTSVEPMLTLDEARDLYSVLRDRAILHPDALGYEAAYEQIEEPKLFMEFIYLLTQGRLLHNRLIEQVQAFENDDALDTLRIISFAHTLGVSISKRALTKLLPRKSRALRILNALQDEYITVVPNSDELQGLHWVRSDHLTRITHGELLEEADTLGELLAMVNEENALIAIERSFERTTMDDVFRTQTICDWVGNDLERMIACLDVCFRASARMFATTHRSLFQTVFERGGNSSLFLLSTELGVTSMSPLGNFLEHSPDQGHLPMIRSAIEDIEKPDYFIVPRHLFSSLSPEVVVGWAKNSSLGLFGRLLDWAHLCNACLPDEVTTTCLARFSPLDQTIESSTMLDLLQGAGRFDPEAYDVWSVRHGQALEQRLRLELDATQVSLNREQAGAEFLITPTSDLSDLSHEAVHRTQILFRAYPHARVYSSHGSDIIDDSFGLARMDGVSILEKQASKDIPVTNKVFDSDVLKTQVVAWEINKVVTPPTLFETALCWEESRQAFHTLLNDYDRHAQSQEVHATKPERNAACPCGSGTKYKKCCYQIYCSRLDASHAYRLLERLPPSCGAWGVELEESEALAREWAKKASTFLLRIVHNPTMEEAANLVEDVREHLENLHTFILAMAEYTQGFEPSIHENEHAPYERLAHRFRLGTQRFLGPPNDSLTQLFLSANCSLGTQIYAEGNLPCLVVLLHLETLEHIDERLAEIENLLVWGQGVWKYLLIPVLEKSRPFEYGFCFTQWNVEHQNIGWYPAIIPERAFETIPPLSYCPRLDQTIATFASKLHHLLTTAEAWENEVLSWQDNGNAIDLVLADKHMTKLNKWIAQALEELEKEICENPFADELDHIRSVIHTSVDLATRD